MKNNEKLSEKLKYYFDTYDTIDLVSKLGSLNLVFNNQNKNHLTTYASIFGLFNQNKGRPLISSKRFKEMVDCLNNSDIMPSILDPAESPFFEKVCLDKDYYLFNGYNHSSVFIADNIIKLVLYYGGDLPKEFITIYLDIIYLFVNISTKIWRELKLNWNDIEDHKGDTDDLIVPLSFDEYAKHLFFSKSEITFFISEDYIEKCLICNNSLPKKFNEAVSQEYPFYYYRPFYKVDEDKYLLIDPTSIGVYIRELGVELSEQYKCKDKFINLYHDLVVQSSKDNCKLISGIEFGEDESDIKLEQGDYYQQSFFNISNTKLLYTLFFYDQGYDSGPQNIVPDSIIDKAFQAAFSHGYKDEDIYSLIVISPFGGLMSVSVGNKLKNPPITLKSDVLNAVRINQEDTPWFLERFSSTFDYYFDSETSFIIDHANLISLLHEKNYDFYIDDNFRIKGNFLNLGFDFIYPYMVEASRKEEETSALVPGFKDPLRLIKIDDYSYTINPMTGIVSNVRLLYTPFSYGGISYISKREDGSGALLSNILNYWINQLRPLLEKHIKGKLLIEISSKENIVFEVVKASACFCKVYYLEDFLISDNDDNNNEIWLTIEVLKNLNLFTNEIATFLQRVSKNKQKKVSYKIDTSETLFLSPLKQDVPFVVISELYESRLEDEIGEFVGENLKIPVGLMDNPKDVTHNIVSFLFQQFENTISKYNWEQTIEFSYLCSEYVTRKLLLEIDNNKHKIALYPQHKDKISDNYNKTNTSSVCIRFIVEYLSAVHTPGRKAMDYVDFQECVTLVSALIKWAKISDAIHCGLIDSLSFLPSYRIGFDKTKLNKFNVLVSDISNYDISHPLTFSNAKFSSWPFKEELAEAYLEEHGFTTDDLMKTIGVLISCGEAQEDDIKKATLDEMLEELHLGPEGILSDETFIKVVEYISLKERTEYLDGSIESRHLYPWKYNRTHSLMRKPLVNCGNYYIWGNRMLNHCYLFIMQTIFSGKEPTKESGKGKLATLNGKILAFEGDDFNNYCFDYLKEHIPTVNFYKKVEVVNQKKIERVKNQSLGDIDVLGIDSDKKRIYLIETKNFFYSRDPYELDVEKKEMFENTKKKRSNLQKELNRLEWAINHINDFVAEYHLKGDGWKVFYTFLSNKPLISCYFNDVEVNQTYLKAIDLKYLRHLK